MPTYLELKEQAEKLLAQAEELRQKETQDAIADIKAKMKAYGITPEDLGFGAGPGARRGGGSARAGAKPGKAVKYRSPDGQTWSGGRGRKPQWVVDALAKGGKLEDFEVR